MLRSILFAFVFYLNTALFLLIGSPLLLGPRRWAMAGLNAHAHASLFWLRLICGTRLEVRGREHLPAGPCIVIAKHQSAWDTFALITLFRDPAVVLKDELKYIPVYGWFCLKFEHILVKRERAAAALKSLVEVARRRVAHGREVVIFPEGTRRAPGAAPEYKPGYVALYEALGVPAIPLALNSGLYWPRRKLARYPGTIIVEILPAIAPGMDRRAFRAEVERRIEGACGRLIEEAARATPAPPLPATTLERERIV